MRMFKWAKDTNGYFTRKHPRGQYTYKKNVQYYEVQLYTHWMAVWPEYPLWEIVTVSTKAKHMPTLEPSHSSPKYCTYPSKMSTCVHKDTTRKFATA